MTQFAAHDDTSIYGLGETSDEAIEDARYDVHDPSANFETSLISDELANWIEENGWDCKRRSFSIVDGFIVDTTDA